MKPDHNFCHISSPHLLNLAFVPLVVIRPQDVYLRAQVTNQVAFWMLPVGPCMKPLKHAREELLLHMHCLSPFELTCLFLRSLFTSFFSNNLITALAVLSLDPVGGPFLAAEESAERRFGTSLSVECQKPVGSSCSTGGRTTGASTDLHLPHIF